MSSKTIDFTASYAFVFAKYVMSEGTAIKACFTMAQFWYCSNQTGISFTGLINFLIMAKKTKPVDKAGTKKAAIKKVVAKKAAAKKPVAVSSKKVAKKAIAKKSPAKKAAVKKAAVKKSVTKKPVTRKAAPKKAVKKAPVKKAAAKKPVAAKKRVTAKPAPVSAASTPSMAELSEELVEKAANTGDNKPMFSPENGATVQPPEDPIQAFDKKVFNKTTSKGDPHSRLHLSSKPKNAIKPSGKKPLW